MGLIGAAAGYAVRPALWQRPRLVGVRARGKLLGVAGTIGGADVHLHAHAGTGRRTSDARHHLNDR